MINKRRITLPVVYSRPFVIIIIIKCIYRASFPYGSKTLYSWQVNNKIIKIITNIKLLSKKKYYYYYCLKEEYYNKK